MQLNDGIGGVDNSIDASKPIAVNPGQEKKILHAVLSKAEGLSILDILNTSAAQLRDLTQEERDKALLSILNGQVENTLHQITSSLANPDKAREYLGQIANLRKEAQRRKVALAEAAIKAHLAQLTQIAKQAQEVPANHGQQKKVLHTLLNPTENIMSKSADTLPEITGDALARVLRLIASKDRNTELVLQFIITSQGGPTTPKGKEYAAQIQLLRERAQQFISTPPPPTAVREVPNTIELQLAPEARLTYDFLQQRLMFFRAMLSTGNPANKDQLERHIATINAAIPLIGHGQSIPLPLAQDIRTIIDDTRKPITDAMDRSQTITQETERTARQKELGTNLQQLWTIRTYIDSHSSVVAQAA